MKMTVKKLKELLEDYDGIGSVLALLVLVFGYGAMCWVMLLKLMGAFGVHLS